MTHTVLYVPGLGDENVAARRLLVASWRLYGVRPVVHQMSWADQQPFAVKLQSLLADIDDRVEAGERVSLVGESAGASAVLNAYAARQNTIHRVACICGKLRNPHTLSQATILRNPAFGESMAMLPASLKALSPARLACIRSVHPLRDPTVPVADTYVEGADWITIPSVGHATSIVIGDIIFGYRLVGFLKRP